MMCGARGLPRCRRRGSRRGLVASRAGFRRGGVAVMPLFLLVACTSHSAGMAARASAAPLRIAATAGPVSLSPTIPAPTPVLTPVPVPVLLPVPRAIDTARFPPGACVSYPSTGGDRGTTVFLDAGHGGPDPGGLGRTTSGRLVEEKTVALDVVLDAVPMLQKLGFTVVVSRTTDTTVARLTAADVSGTLLTVAGVRADLQARTRCANEAGAAVLVSVHFNSASSPRNAGALSVYDGVRPFGASNLRFASLLETNVLRGLNARGWAIPDAGVVSDTTVGTALSSADAAYGHLVILGPSMAGYFTSPSTMPGSVIEPLFLTDPFEADVATSAQGQASIAAGIASAVTQFLGHS
jgi:N-acetylmuramoyl-L-alanine amidase